MKLQIFKERDIDYNSPVEIYRCLNRKGVTFSIRQNGLVVAHTDEFVLKDCTFHVNTSGHKRYCDTEQRNVHAYVKGVLDLKEVIPYEASWPLVYNLVEGYFMVEDIPIEKASCVYLQGGKIKVQL